MNKNIVEALNSNNFALFLGDAFDLIKMIPDNSVHFVVTDPPYFIDGMDGNWDIYY